MGRRKKEILDKNEKERAEAKRDINYSPKQEQQIPIKSDWQMPSCFKRLLRLVIVVSIPLAHESEPRKTERDCARGKFLIPAR